MNEETNNIFKLLLENDKQKLEDDIKKNIKIINFNIEDNKQKTIIDYLIRFNNFDTLEFILKNRKVSVLRNRHILKSPIKNGFNKIVEILLNYDNQLINYIDNEDLNIFCYSVKYNNLEALKLLDKQIKGIDKTNFYKNLKDNEANDFFHYTIKNNIENCSTIFKTLNVKNFDDTSNNSNTTILMDFYKNENLTDDLKEYIKSIIQNPNLTIQDNETDSTLFHHLANLEYYDDVVHFLNINNKNLNLQNIKGETLNHILIRKLYTDQKNVLNILEVLNKIIDKDINYNIYDIKLKTPFYLFIKILNLYEKEKERRRNPMILEELIKYGKKLISFCNLNIQDLNYSTPLHLLCQNNLFKYFKEELVNKKINITIKDKDNKTPLDYLDTDKERYNDFLNIFIDSYINYLNNNKFNNSEFNTKCLKNVEDCKNKIKEKIKDNDLKEFDITKRKLNIDNLTKLKDKKEINHIYLGTSLDILCVCQLLKSKYKNVYYPHDKNLNNNSTFPIIQFYKSNNFKVDNENILDNNFIFWIPNTQSLYLNPHVIHKFEKKKDKTIFIPLLIYYQNQEINHMNMLFINNKKIYHYDPYGTVNNRELKIDLFINQLTKELNNNYEYINPTSYLNKFGLQYFEELDKSVYYFNDSTSYCIIWCFVFSKLYFDNPNLGFEKLVKYMRVNIFQNQLNLKKIIKDNLVELIYFRNQKLKNMDLDINQYYNNNLSLEVYYKILNDK